MKKLGTLLVAVSCLAGVASAQNTTAAAPAPAVAPAPAIDPARLALAHEVIQAMQADRSLDAMTVQIKQMVAQQTAALAPADATAEQKAKITAAQNEAMDLAMSAAKAMIAKMDGVYAEVFSVEELQSIKAFYLSSGGQAMVAKQPLLMQKMMPLIQQMQGELMPKIGARLQKARQEAMPPPAPVSATTPPIEVPASK